MLRRFNIQTDAQITVRLQQRLSFSPRRLNPDFLENLCVRYWKHCNTVGAVGVSYGAIRGLSSDTGAFTGIVETYCIRPGQTACRYRGPRTRTGSHYWGNWHLNQKIAALQAEIADRQKALRDLIEQERKKQKPVTANHRKRFDPETLRRHKAQRSPLIPNMINLPWQVHLSSPFVYGMIVPIAILDLSLVVFQATCFRLWGVERARRSDFVIVDRHYLAYLNGIEKLNCVYCGYANGVFAFARELAARTEKF